MKSSILGHKTLYFWAQNPLFFASPRLYSTFLGGIWGFLARSGGVKYSDFPPNEEHGAEAAAAGARSGARGLLPKKQRPGSGGGEAQRYLEGKMGQKTVIS